MKSYDQLEQNSQLSSFELFISESFRSASASICSGVQSGLAILISDLIKLLFCGNVWLVSCMFCFKLKFFIYFHPPPSERYNSTRALSC